jgi:HK97 family phage major capsid protein
MANPFQPAVATGNVAIQFGDFNAGYTFREVLPGVVIKKSSDRFIELNALGIFAFARVGGAVTNPGSVVANTTQPVISLTVS